jgi:hypothetical protein
MNKLHKKHLKRLDRLIMDKKTEPSEVALLVQQVRLIGGYFEAMEITVDKNTPLTIIES